MVRIKIANPDINLRSGMSALLDIEIINKEGVISIPYEYVLKKEDRAYAFLAKGEKIEIKLGSQNETSFEVIEGLKEGDLLKQIDWQSLETEKGENS